MNSIQGKTILPIVARWMSKLWFAIIELVLFLPVVMLIAIYIFPASFSWVWLAELFAFYALGMLLRQISARFPWQVGGILLIASPGILSYLLVSEGYFWLAMWFAGIIACYRGYIMMAKEWYHFFRWQMYLSGLLLYFITYIFYVNVETMRAHLGLITAGGIASLIVVFFIHNAKMLRHVTHDGNRAPSSPVTLYNLLMVAMVLLAVFIIAGFSYIRNAFRWLLDGIAACIAFLVNLIARPGNNIPEEMIDEDPSLGMGEPSSLMVHLEKVAIIIAIIIGLALCFLLLRYGLPRLMNGLRKAMTGLANFLRKLFGIEAMRQHAPAGYIDEQSKLTDLKDLTDSYANRMKAWLKGKWVREPGWNQLANNRERAKYLYRSLVNRSISDGYRYRSELTPLETGKDIDDWQTKRGLSAGQQHESITQLYNRARYSEENIDDLEIETAMKDKQP